MNSLLEKVEHLEHEAAHFGFQWENTAQIMQQIQSECLEVEAHLLSDDSNRAHLEEEIGDLLHAVFSLCVFCQFSPTTTLKKSLEKFERRLQSVKSIAKEQALDSVHGRSFSELMSLWDEAKKRVG